MTSQRWERVPVASVSVHGEENRASQGRIGRRFEGSRHKALSELKLARSEGAKNE